MIVIKSKLVLMFINLKNIIWKKLVKKKGNYISLKYIYAFYFRIYFYNTFIYLEKFEYLKIFL